MSQSLTQRLPRAFLCVAMFFISCSAGESQGMNENDSFAMLLDAIETSDDANVQAALLKGILRGLEGRRNVPAPKGWIELSKKLSASGDMAVRDRSLVLSQIFGDESAMQRAIERVKDTSLDAGQRRSALRSLLNQQNREASELLPSLIDDSAMRLDAIRGFAIVESRDAPRVLLARYPGLEPQQRRAVIETLASRKAYAEALLKAVEQGDIPREDIPTQVARFLEDLLGDRFTSVFGVVRAVSEDRAEQLAKYKNLCSPAALESADASRGRVVFQKTCASCHKLYGTGAKSDRT